MAASSYLDGYTMHLISVHDDQAVISIEEAAKVVKTSSKHARLLATQGRFPVFGTTSAASNRESTSVFIPTLVQWMAAGGTRQYDALPTVEATPKRERPSPTLDWYDKPEAA